MASKPKALLGEELGQEQGQLMIDLAQMAWALILWPKEGSKLLRALLALESELQGWIRQLAEEYCLFF